MSKTIVGLTITDKTDLHYIKRDKNKTRGTNVLTKRLALYTPFWKEKIQNTHNPSVAKKPTGMV
jgi:hypothetical protein